MTMPSNKWEEAVCTILVSLNCRTDLDGEKFDQRRHKGIPPKAKKAIRQAVGEEMIGLLPDEIVNDDAKRLRDGTFVRGDDMRRIGHNDCLRELRQKIKEWEQL